MCGIAGLWNFNGDRAEPSRLARMIQMIRHRGPDDCGVHTDGSTGIAHARLSIIDLGGGHQPMSTRDGDLWITFNGEIFNYIELRDELIAKGHRFETNSDTEVILHQYLLKGEDCVEDFEGQWAFAIWDTRNRKLFLSRDRLGVRPLFYRNRNNTFLFASEMKALLAHPDVSRELDYSGLDQIFTFWSTVPPKTIFKDICELPPGHSLTVTENNLRLRRYWQADFNIVERSEDDACEELASLLINATRLRLRADVPVGAYLSGGLDSSIITALIRKFSTSPLETFSVAFDDPEFDETPYQETVSEFLGVQRNAVRCDSNTIGEIFPQVVWHAERPILRTAPAPMFLLARLVRERGYKVVLTGEGADEMFGGYDLFKETKIRAFWGRQPESAMRPKLLSRLYPYLPKLQMQSPAYLQAFFKVGASDLSSPFFSHLPRWELTAKLKTFFSDEVSSHLRSSDPLGELEGALPADFAKWEPFHRAQYLESSILMPGYILSSQGDRMALAHGVEARFPFLDSKVVQFANSLPLHLKMKVLNEKYLLKKFASDLIPEVVTQRRKQPYRAPDGASFDYSHDLLSEEQLRKSGAFKPGAVQSLANKFRRGQAIGVKDNMALVGILSTQLVIQQFIQNLECPNETRVTPIHR
jgi:asparagine synthase (glutamine-hydrolysing)